MEHQVRIDESRCTGCGACVSDCPAFNIELRELCEGAPGSASAGGTARQVAGGTARQVADGTARQVAMVWDPDSCLFCGHCEAICPAAAVTLTGFADVPEEVGGPARLDADTLLQAIRTRRSIRHFKSGPVPEDILMKILEAGRFTQTAKNSQRQSYAVLRDRIGEAEKTAVAALRQLLGAAEDGSGSGALGRAKIGDDFMFFGAPLAIVVLSPSKTDGCLAAQNMSLMAEACGLGVLFSGFFTDVANEVPTLREMLGINDTRQAVATLVLGWPDVKYRRTVRREPAKVTWL